MPDPTPVPPPNPPTPPAAPAGPTIQHWRRVRYRQEKSSARQNGADRHWRRGSRGVPRFLSEASQAAGLRHQLDNVVAVEIAGQGSTMVALTFTLNNTSEKILYVRNIQASIKTDNGRLPLPPTQSQRSISTGTSRPSPPSRTAPSRRCRQKPRFSPAKS